MSRDQEYMEIALDEARRAMREGNLPIGAVLLIDDKVIGTGRNDQVNRSDFFSHAESLLIGKNASRIKETYKRKGKIELFTTLEPCLMCFGTSVHNRIGRIVYGCRDPLAGASSIQSPTDWYKKRWPEIVGDVHRDISYELFTRYMGEHLDIWEDALRQFEEMKKSW